MIVISEVNVTPIRPRDGLIAFASCVIDGRFYCGSIGVHVQPNGNFRLVFPSKKVCGVEMGIFHPIDRTTGEVIEAAIFKKCDEIFGGRCEEGVEYDGHRQTDY